MSALLAVDGLVKRFGGLIATDRLDLAVEEGELHALIGPNGAGKTTLIAQLAGEIAPTAGRIRFAGADVTALPVHARVRRGLVRSFQITAVCPGLTALENVILAVQAASGHCFRFWRPAANDLALTGPAQAMLDRVGLAHGAGRPAGQLAHGEQRQLELAMALAAEPRLLLLDEPMAGMGPEESARMADLLASLKGRHTILLIEHDMDAVFRLADRVSVLVAGRCIASGSPAAIRADEGVRAAYLGEEGHDA